MVCLPSPLLGLGAHDYVLFEIDSCVTPLHSQARERQQHGLVSALLLCIFLTMLQHTSINPSFVVIHLLTLGDTQVLPTTTLITTTGKGCISGHTPVVWNLQTYAHLCLMCSACVSIIIFFNFHVLGSSSAIQYYCRKDGKDSAPSTGKATVPTNGQWTKVSVKVTTTQAILTGFGITYTVNRCTANIIGGVG